MRFVLVHGGFHGSWCWELLIPELVRKGHRAVAVTLPGSAERVEESTSSAAVRDTVLEVIEPGDVLVGHSGGGYGITLAADAATSEVSHLVYLAAGFPSEGSSINETIRASNQGDRRATLRDASDPDLPVQQLEDQQALQILPGEASVAFFYQDCPPEVAAWASSRITRQRTEYRDEKISIPAFWGAELPRSFIRCAQDRAQPEAVASWFSERLGVEPFVIDTSHSPFLSRPAELATLLEEATRSRPTGELRRW